MKSVARVLSAKKAPSQSSKFKSVLRKEYGETPLHQAGVSGRLTGLAALRAAHARHWRQTQSLYLVSDKD